MAADMKQMIADAVRTLIVEKNKKRITVKDIVEECNITRQAFYYHFADIPELLKWIASKQADELKESLGKDLTPQERIKCWFLLYLNCKKEFKKMEQSNYGEEVRDIVISQVFRTLHEIAEEAPIEVDGFEREFMIRYHGYAALGLLSSWTDEDTKNIDRIVQDIYLLVTGKMQGCSCE